MKKKLLFMMTALLLPMLASASDIQVANDDGVTICYNYINNGKELELIKVDCHYSGIVNIPDSVTFMGRTRNVTSIGEGAFISCNLTSVTIPNSVTSIGEGAFRDCYHLTSVTIPNSVKSIGNYAFAGCWGLTSVTIPNGVTHIGDWAFSACRGLTSITIPNSLTSINEWSFYGCASLTSVIIPNNVTSIGVGAFGDCSSLTSITLPNSVISIGGQAFMNCNLTIVNSLITEPFDIFENAFSQNTVYNATLKVPAGTVDKYKATNGWNIFQFIEEISDDSSKSQK